MDVPDHPEYTIKENGEIIHKETGLSVLQRVFYNTFDVFVLLKHPHGYSQYVMVAKILATVFLPNPNNYTKFIFKDKCHANIALSNLEWIPDDYTNPE
jgi:hypothetical protein